MKPGTTAPAHRTIGTALKALLRSSKVGAVTAVAAATFLGMPAATAAEPAPATTTKAKAFPVPGATLIDRIVAVVNTDPVTLFELMLKAAPYEARLRANGGPKLEAALTKLRAEVLDSLVNDILIRAEARKMRLEVTQDQIDAHMTQIKNSNSWDDDELAEAVKQIGFDSIADYRKNVKRELLKQQAIGYRVRAKVKVTDAEVAKELEERLKSGEGGVEERRAAHILFKVAEFATDADITALVTKLKAIRAEAMSGQTTFEELARKHSQDTNAGSGGDFGWLTKGDTDPDFEEIVWGIGKDEISQPTKTDYGYHLIKVTDVRRKTSLDKDKRDSLLRQIRYRMRQKEAARLLEIWMKELRKNVFIEVKDPALRPFVKSLQGQKKLGAPAPRR